MGAALEGVVRKSAGMTAEVQELQQASLATERYGDEAFRFCVAPPNITTLLPMSLFNPEEEAFNVEVEDLAVEMSAVKDRFLAHVLDAKARNDREALRSLGPRLS